MSAIWPRAALFDLDGTLIDSVPDIAQAVAELLATENLPPIADSAVRAMIGRGMPTLVERAFAASGRPLDDSNRAPMVERMMTIYPRHLIDRTVLMPGALAALDHLAGLGSRLAIVTNKPEAFCETILGHFGLLERFELVLGDQPLARRLAPKPAPDMLLFALAQLGATPADAVMIGDSGADIESGRAAGTTTIAIRGGYSSTPIEDFAPTLVLNTLADLPAGLAKLIPAG